MRIHNNVHLIILLIVLSSDANWVDPDTPESARFNVPFSKGDGRQFQLVFSDEFEQEGRTFHDGNDPRWTAIDKNDYTNSALHYYSQENAKTTNGVLNITTEQKVNVYKAFDEEKKRFYADQKYIQTGMLQSWNKFCFIGGIVEFRAKLPGNPRIGGLWPALWLLGNLARATYVGSTDYVWPFSYNVCNERTRKSQEIDACSRVNHYGLAPYRGRGAPEIDVIESMQGIKEQLPSTHIQRPYQSASLQIAPGIEVDRPVLGSRPHAGHWYDHLEYGNETASDLNPFFYGVVLEHKPKIYTYQADALSANMQLNDTHYQQQHLYRVEWEPPKEDGSGGYIKWFTDNKFVYGIHGKSLEIMQTEIPSEPMYLIMNTAVSSHWGFPAPCPDGCECECFECGNPACQCALPVGYCDNFPASFEIDYVRVYQAVNESSHILGCSPEHRPTALFIEGHRKRYTTEGQSRPLEPIKKGGARCSNVSDCGGSTRGECSSSGVCQCHKKSTGPSCLAHAGFYDVDSSKPVKPLSWYHMVMPSSFQMLILAMAISLLTAIIVDKRRRSKERQYIKVGPTSYHDRAFHPPQNVSDSSYQQPNGDNYTLPPTPKVVTYCVIDNRLIDRNDNN